MFDFLKEPLYKWHTRRRNQRTIAELEAHLEAHAPLLLVHQMGRAGSMTTTQSLRSSGIALPVYHTHWLHPDNIAKRLARFADVPESHHPLNVRVGRRISEELLRESTDRRKWNLVTVFREPVARNISVFFLSIEVFVENFSHRFERGELSNDALLEIFLREFPHDQPLLWFDMEMLEMFGLDVYHYPFPKHEGYQIIRTKPVDLLLIKIEDLNRCYQGAFGEFLGVDMPRLEQTHITEQDPTRSMYQDFLKNAVLPDEYLDHMYQSRFAQHFYSSEELAAFRRKWSSVQ